ncbi:MAG: hypothetical protein JXR60_03465 [Bacteroidales bacterium]|nr:hypothetical protein [Bacteroidales bacterium]
MNISPVHYIALPLLAAFLIPLLSKLHKELARIVPGLVFLYFLVISVVLMQRLETQPMISEVIAGWSAPWGINLVFTPFSGFLVSLMSFIGFLVWVYSYHFKKIDYMPAQKYFILLMMLVTGSIGIVLTGDIFNLFVFLEIVAISAYSLTAFYPGRDGAEAAFKYLLVGSFASALILLAIVILYTQTGTLNMADLAVKMHEVPHYLKVIIFVLFLVGFGIEAEMFPLNGWAPDAYSQAPGPIGAVFAGIVVKGGIYALVRVVYTIFDLSGVGTILIALGLVTMIIAELAALRQDNLKRMLAYSSIGQMGVVLIAFGIGTDTAIFAALFLMLNHALIKSMLFFSASYLLYNSTTKTIKELTGMAKHLPFVSFIFALGAFAIVGLPPFSGFWSKLYFLMAAADAQMVLLIITVLSVSVIEIIYYFRVIGKIYSKDETSELEPKKPTINSVLVMTVLGALIIIIGVYPDLVTDWIHHASDALVNKSNYIQNVLTENLPR